MISHEHKIIFIHIPKCAGTSIETALGHLDNHTGRRGQDHRTIRKIERPIPPAALTSKDNLRELLARLKGQYFSTAGNPKNRYTVTAAQYRTYYKFTIVRNPWARAFSWYKAVMQDDIIKKQLGIQTQLSLEEALRQFAGRGLLRPQLDWLKNFNGELPLDYIGRFETLAADFATICHQANLPHIQLPHKLKGSTAHYRDHYNEQAKQIIATIYAEEIQLFNYTF